MICIFPLLRSAVDVATGQVLDKAVDTMPEHSFSCASSFPAPASNTGGEPLGAVAFGCAPDRRVRLWAWDAERSHFVQELAVVPSSGGPGGEKAQQLQAIAPLGDDGKRLVAGGGPEGKVHVWRLDDGAWEEQGGLQCEFEPTAYATVRRKHAGGAPACLGAPATS